MAMKQNSLEPNTKLEIICLYVVGSSSKSEIERRYRMASSTSFTIFKNKEKI
jgi:hypothetical protein